MNKMSTLLTALLFASISFAHAETSGQPTQPAATGAASVQKNLDANKSNGKADKGLNTALSHINDQHGKAETSERNAEKVEHVVVPERPSTPEHPGR
ncbi:hypothetical protein GALL_146040 [mine drainage metagenome]|uniref:Uncharacterized protein n=1 Tax=mine drainage metagenome TaxID=410659 RepID=A0A1J5SNS7_9ZZZZ